MLHYLMNNDIPVLAYDMADQYMVVMNNEMLPYGLKDYVQTTNFDSPDNIKKAMKDMDELKYFFSGRILCAGRSNAKAILGSSALPQMHNTKNMLQIVEACQGLSVNDNFWIKKENENISYADIDIRRNPLSGYAYEIAILGKHISVTAKELRPELVTDGMYPKVWMMENGMLELWKTDITCSFVNTRAEVKASYILDHSNVNHVRYEERKQGDILFAVSKCVSNEHLSHISAQGVRDWCKHTGIDFLEYVEERFPEDFHRMVFTDYILANTDRHFGNWWFQVNADTNQIVKLGALMDHNQALTADMFETDVSDLVYEPTGLTFEETVKRYARYVREITIDENILPEACKRRYDHIKTMEGM